MEQQWGPRKREGNNKVSGRGHMRQVQGRGSLGQAAGCWGEGEQRASLVLREALALPCFPSDDD